MRQKNKILKKVVKKGSIFEVHYKNKEAVQNNKRKKHGTFVLFLYPFLNLFLNLSY
jgi:hypothetical protein